MSVASSTTSTTQFTAMFQDYIDALLTGGEFGRFLTDDVEWTTVETGEIVTGRDAVVAHIDGLHHVLFDAHPEPRAMGSAGSHAFFEADFVGTHIGKLGDVEPTGASVRVPYCVVYDLTADGIRALRFHMSFATLFGQLSAADR